MDKPDKCQIKGCKASAQYWMLVKRKPTWVCEAHEKMIGDEHERQVTSAAA